MRAFFCRIGLHNYKWLTGEEGKPIPSNTLGGHPHFLHVKKCKWCGKIHATVEVEYDSFGYIEYEYRDATNDELMDFLNQGCDGY